MYSVNEKLYSTHSEKMNQLYLQAEALGMFTKKEERMGLSIFDFEDGKCYKYSKGSNIYKRIGNLVYFYYKGRFDTVSHSFECEEDYHEVPDPTIKMVTLEIPEDLLNEFVHIGCKACAHEEGNCAGKACVQGRQKFIEQFIKKEPE